MLYHHFLIAFFFAVVTVNVYSAPINLPSQHLSKKDIIGPSGGKPKPEGHNRTDPAPKPHQKRKDIIFSKKDTIGPIGGHPRPEGHDHTDPGPKPHQKRKEFTNKGILKRDGNAVRSQRRSKAQPKPHDNASDWPKNLQPLNPPIFPDRRAE